MPHEPPETRDTAFRLDVVWHVVREKLPELAVALRPLIAPNNVG